MDTLDIRTGDSLEVLRTIPSGTVRTCVTSPPYFGLRDYGHEGQIGLEATLDDYITNLVNVFREVRRVLTEDGTLWLNLGDSFSSGGRKTTGRNDAVRHGIPTGGGFKAGPRSVAGSDGLPAKNLIGVPWRVAFALQADGWILRSDIIWHKPNAMPESVKDRPTKAHEYVFLFAKNPSYFYDADAVMEPISAATKAKREKLPGAVAGAATGLEPSGKRHKRTVWSVNTKPYKGAHFAVFPEALVEPCILAGSKPGDTVLDPFNGAGTTGLVALRHGRSYLGIELNPEYVELTRKRLSEALRLQIGNDPLHTSP